MQEIMQYAKEIARIGDSSDTQIPMLQLVRGKYAALTESSQHAKQISQSYESRTAPRLA